MNKYFDEISQSFMEPITRGELRFRSRSGVETAAQPEDTLLYSENIAEIDIFDKYKNTINVMAFDPVNARRRLDTPCKCGRDIVAIQRLGENKTVFNACLCGRVWTD